MDTTEIEKYISIIADIITIVLATYAVMFGLFKRTKSLTGFKINYYVSKIFKTGVIIFVAGIIFEIDQEIILSIIKDDLMSTTLQLLTAIFAVTMGIFLFWLIVPIIWTSSFVYTVEFINLFLPNNYKINTEKFKNEVFFRIDKATYGKDNNVIDVTDKLQQMVKNNSLEITANNSLAGDPIVGTAKELVIDYAINGITKKEIIKEKETKIIPN